MTATRAKGKEFDTVILLDVNENVVVQTRRDATRHQGRAQVLLRRVHQGQGRVVLVLTKGVPVSRFVGEMELSVS